MKKHGIVLIAFIMMLTVFGCGEKQDPNLKRGDLFLENKKFSEAITAYEAATKTSPELMENDDFRMKFKDAYYFKGGQIELSAEEDEDILKAAYNYYVKGFDIWPKEVGMCDKLVQYYWEHEDFKMAAKYLKYLIEFDAAMPETDKNKWDTIHRDYYNLGYALFEIKQYQEAKEAFEQSLKAKKNGPNAAKSKSAIAAIAQKLEK